MEPLFRTAEEYYRDTVLSQFEISEFEFKFLSDLDNIDTLDIEEVETKIIKFDFSGYEKSYYFYLNNYLNSFADHYELQYIEDEKTDFKKLHDLLVNTHNLQFKSNDLFLNITKETISSSIRYFFTSGYKYNSLLHPNHYRKTLASINKIIAFLEFKKSEINDNKPNNIDLFELVDLNESNITEKIIVLSRLGVLDFLRGQEPFNLSINSLANAISAFTGGNSRTIQSMINPMFSKNVDTKNNPFNTNKTVDKVDQKLIDLGFKLKKDELGKT